MSGKYIISRDDWSLHRKGELDRQRHHEKMKEAIKKNLADVVSEESIMFNIGHNQKEKGQAGFLTEPLIFLGFRAYSAQKSARCGGPAFFCAAKTPGGKSGGGTHGGFFYW